MSQSSYWPLIDYLPVQPWKGSDGKGMSVGVLFAGQVSVMGRVLMDVLPALVEVK